MNATKELVKTLATVHSQVKGMYTSILPLSFIMNTSKAFDIIEVSLLFVILRKYLSFH